MKYRIVKVTIINGEEFWSIQKEFKHWLTRKPVWKYYNSSWAIDSEYTRWVSDADQFHTQADAIKKMENLIKRDNRDVVDIQVVKTVDIRDDGKVNEE